MVDLIGGTPEIPVPSGIRFSPTIELGHLLQALVILASVGGWAVVGYYTIEKQIDLQNTAIEKSADRQDAELMLLKQRTAIIEGTVVELRQGLQTTANETRQQLSKIIDQVADIRTLVASLGARADARHR